MLASVSPELAKSALDCRPIIISKSAFRIFAVWLLYRNLDDVESAHATWINQVSLAEAWGLGAEYHIPAFQNAVMRRLKFEFTRDIIDADAVKEVYRTADRDTKLQQAFVAHLVSDSVGDPELAWQKEDFTYRAMDKIPGFCLDMAVRYGAQKFPSEDSMDIENFLVDEDDEDEEDGEDGEDCDDGEDDESVTEG
jgi:hypothetical protein